MAVTETMTKIVCNTVLNDGVDSEGRTRTISQGIGTLNAATWDIDKAVNILNPLVACLSKTLYGIQTIKTNDVVIS